MEKYKISFTFERIVEANSLEEAENMALDQFAQDDDLFNKIWPIVEITAEVIE